jgi:hypothetical protein
LGLPPGENIVWAGKKTAHFQCPESRVTGQALRWIHLWRVYGGSGHVATLTGPATDYDALETISQFFEEKNNAK